MARKQSAIIGEVGSNSSTSLDLTLASESCSDLPAQEDELNLLTFGLEDASVAWGQGFSKSTFALVKQLYKLAPRSAAFKEEFRRFVHHPMEALVRSLEPLVEARFPGLIETRIKATWGAFFQKDRAHRQNPHLLIKLSPTQLWFGLMKGKKAILVGCLPDEEVIDLGSDILREIEETFLRAFRPFSKQLASSESLPSSIDHLFERIHLSPQSREGRLLKSVYDSALKTDSLAFPFRQIIFYGPPGTGKTLTAELMATLFASKPENIERIQFHPAYSYEDFIGGLKPKVSPSGGSYLFEFESGIFKRLCDRAAENPQEKFVILIDEINRGNVSSIFGELLWAIEYRGQSLTLPYKEAGRQIQFCVPPNVFLIGTMNSADRSIALIDYAFRRRFKFIEVVPKVEVLDEFLRDADANLRKKVKQLFLLLNRKLAEINPDLCVGHSYFKNWPGEPFTEGTLERIWEFSIIPLIREYFYTESRISDFYLKNLLLELEGS